MKRRRRTYMKAMAWIGLALFAFTLLAATGMFLSAHAYDPFALDETRYCGQPKRNTAGQIIRSSAVRDAFMRVHPCPVTGKINGACPGWQVDHIIPLASCGCDSVDNMQWLPVEIKTCAGVACKDRWERRVYTCP